MDDELVKASEEIVLVASGGPCLPSLGGEQRGQGGTMGSGLDSALFWFG